MRHFTKEQWKQIYRKFRINQTNEIFNWINGLEYRLCYKVFNNNPANFYEPISDLKLKLYINEIFKGSLYVV